ncbi:hypothetical protein AgCh_040317 [Apium graveolens]
MEKMKISTMTAVYMLLMFLLIINSPALGCYSDRSGCSGCIAKRFKSRCPPCQQIMRCMAQCLWDGTSQSKCIKKCDCNGGYPKVSDCKKCLAKCKCSCSM